MVQICFGTYLSQKIDVYGRKKMAMIGICGIISGCALLAFSYSTAAGSVSTGLIAILGILLFRVSFSLSLGPIPYVVSSEVFPKDARSSGVALATLVQWLCNVLVTFTFLSFVDTFGACNVFVAYTFVGVLALASVHYLLPETNQQKLEDN
jgi:MFS family permease